MEGAITLTDSQAPSAFVAPITPRYRDVFYSSIPVSWSDPSAGCVTCLPCARDTFEPPSSATIFIDGKAVT